MIGKERVESSLHTNLAEHLNSEIVLGTITDVAVAVHWIRSTFLYIRALKNPKYYGIPDGLSTPELEARLQALCLRELNGLEKYELIKKTDFAYNVEPTENGKLMARLYIAFETMKIFMKVKGTENLAQILDLISMCYEFNDVQLRVNERTPLNILNRAKNMETIRYPIPGRIKSKDMKVNCLLQSFLGYLPIPDASLAQEAHKIVRISERIAKALSLYLWQKDFFQALESALILAKCLSAKMWENSVYLTRQLPGIGPTFASLLVAAKKTTFQSVIDSNPRDLERILNKHPPFGNNLQEAARSFPIYDLKLTYSELSRKVCITLQLLNAERIKDVNHTSSLLVADNNNKLLYKEKIRDGSLIMQQGKYEFSLNVSPGVASVVIHLISDKIAGIDVKKTLSLTNPINETRVTTPPEENLCTQPKEHYENYAEFEITESNKENLKIKLKRKLPMKRTSGGENKIQTNLHQFSFTPLREKKLRHSDPDKEDCCDEVSSSQDVLNQAYANSNHSRFVAAPLSDRENVQKYNHYKNINQSKGNINKNNEFENNINYYNANTSKLNDSYKAQNTLTEFQENFAKNNCTHIIEPTSNKMMLQSKTKQEIDFRKQNYFNKNNVGKITCQSQNSLTCQSSLSFNSHSLNHIQPSKTILVKTDSSQPGQIRSLNSCSDTEIYKCSPQNTNKVFDSVASTSFSEVNISSKNRYQPKYCQSYSKPELINSSLQKIQGNGKLESVDTINKESLKTSPTEFLFYSRQLNQNSSIIKTRFNELQPIFMKDQFRMDDKTDSKNYLEACKLNDSFKPIPNGQTVQNQSSAPSVTENFDKQNSAIGKHGSEEELTIKANESCSRNVSTTKKEKENPLKQHQTDINARKVQSQDKSNINQLKMVYNNQEITMTTTESSIRNSRMSQNGSGISLLQAKGINPYSPNNEVYGGKGIIQDKEIINLLNDKKENRDNFAKEKLIGEIDNKSLNTEDLSENSSNDSWLDDLNENIFNFDEFKLPKKTTGILNKAVCEEERKRNSSISGLDDLFFDSPDENKTWRKDDINENLIEDTTHKIPKPKECQTFNMRGCDRYSPLEAKKSKLEELKNTLDNPLPIKIHPDNIYSNEKCLSPNSSHYNLYNQMDKQQRVLSPSFNPDFCLNDFSLNQKLLRSEYGDPFAPIHNSVTVKEIVENHERPSTSNIGCLNCCPNVSTNVEIFKFQQCSQQIQSQVLNDMEGLNDSHCNKSFNTNETEKNNIEREHCLGKLIPRLMSKSQENFINNSSRSRNVNLCNISLKNNYPIQKQISNALRQNVSSSFTENSEPRNIQAFNIFRNVEKNEVFDFKNERQPSQQSFEREKFLIQPFQVADNSDPTNFETYKKHLIKKVHSSPPLHNKVSKKIKSEKGEYGDCSSIRLANLAFPKRVNSPKCSSTTQSVVTAVRPQSQSQTYIFPSTSNHILTSITYVEKKTASMQKMSTDDLNPVMVFSQYSGHNNQTQPVGPTQIQNLYCTNRNRMEKGNSYNIFKPTPVTSNFCDSHPQIFQPQRQFYMSSQVFYPIPIPKQNNGDDEFNSDELETDEEQVFSSSPPLSGEYFEEAISHGKSGDL